MKYLHALLFVCVSILSTHGIAQPYIDLVNIRFSESPANTGLLNQGKQSMSMQHAVAGFNLPVPLNKQQTDALLILPYVEQWKIQLPGKSATLHGLGIPVGIQKTINAKWRLNTIIFYRI